jgi:hypothetical protein
VTVAGSGEQWRWADPQGTQRVVHFDELRAALASGTLPPYTLVWRPGMSGWQPAYSVGELATAAISAREGVIPNVPPPPLHIVAVQAEYERRADDKNVRATEGEPPPPPVHEYPAIAAASPAYVARPRGAGSVRPAVPTSPAASAERPGAAAPSGDDDEDGVLQTVVARPVIVPAAYAARPASPAAVGPPLNDARSAPVRAHVPPTSRAPGRSSLPPPPRRSYPAPMSQAPPTPSLRHTIPGPGAPRSALSTNAPPIAVPPPRTVPPAGSTQPPPFNGEPEGASRKPASLDPPPRSVHAEPTAARAARGDDQLPSFPLEETRETPEPLEPSGASLARDAESRSEGPDASAPRRAASPRALLQQLGPLARRARSLVRQRLLPRVREGVAYARAHPKDPKVLGALGGGVFLLTLAIAGIVAGAVGSGASEASVAPAGSATSRVAPAVAPSLDPVIAPRAATAAALPVAGSPAAPLSACRLTREATRLALRASKDVPLELASGLSGNRAWLGYAVDAASARGVEIDVEASTATSVFAARANKLRGVVPVILRGKASFAVNADGKRDKLQAWRTVASDPPHVIGWSEHALAVARRPSDAARALWPLDGDTPPDAIRSISAGDHEVVAFRRQGGIWMGLLGKDQTPEGSVTRVAGAGSAPGSPIGSPTLASNGRAIAVAFADRASSAEPWSLRVGSAALGTLPTQTSAVRVPEGGPGGAALAPALAGRADGRWLMVWTEGSGGRHDVRGQTFAADFSPLGAPFGVAHADDNAGQGALALSAERGFVAYLRLTDQGYEIWGAGLDCR